MGKLWDMILDIICNEKVHIGSAKRLFTKENPSEVWGDREYERK